MSAIEMKDKCVQWIRDWFDENGPGCNAIIGISGGKDSTITAALCVEALGKERVIGVIMPDGVQEDIEDAYEVCEYLGIEYITWNIGHICHDILQGISDLNMKLSNQTCENLPPRIRMAILYAISQSNNGRVANTCNYSEEYLGYSTRWGDDVGDFSLLGNCTVTEVKKLGYALELPEKFIEKTPSDGLCGKTDEDRFGFTYEELDKYLIGAAEPSPEVKQLIDERHQANLFKFNKILDTWDSLEQELAKRQRKEIFGY